jgi:hypothetical protein
MRFKRLNEWATVGERCPFAPRPRFLALLWSVPPAWARRSSTGTIREASSSGQAALRRDRGLIELQSAPRRAVSSADGG